MFPDYWRFEAAVELAKEHDNERLHRIVLELGAELLKRGGSPPSEGAMRQEVASDEASERWHRGLCYNYSAESEEIRSWLMEAWEKWQVPEVDRRWEAAPFDVTPDCLKSNT
jgi:hypothetical protein